MGFEITETQTITADMAGRLFAERNNPELRRERLTAPTPDRLALWPLIAEQGLLILGADEEHGGLGGGARDLAVIMSSVGEWLVVEPMLASYLALHILQSADQDNLFETDIATITSGEAVFTFAHQESVDPFAMPNLRAEQTPDGLRLTGTKPLVRHGDIANSFIVTAMLDDTLVFCTVKAESEGVKSKGFRLMDASSASTLTLDNASARHIASGDALLASVMTLAIACQCAEASGICAAANRMTFEYLTTRKQFGLTLASFQALQHRAADMHIAAEEMRCLTDDLLSAIDAGAPDTLDLARLAKAHADECGRTIGYDAVQLHGGMGVSDELIISHYMKRLAVMRQAFGSADVHLADAYKSAKGATR